MFRVFCGRTRTPVSASSRRATAVGYASCWPIRDAVYRKLRLGEGVSGGMSEADFRAAHILSDTEDDKADALYIPSVVVLDHLTYKGRYRAAVLQCALLEHIRTFCVTRVPNRSLWLFVVCFTDEGENLTRRIGENLNVIEPAGFLTIYGERKPFYEVRINGRDWDRLVDRVEGKLFRSMFSAAKKG
jgi:hypothetical protein